MDWMAEGAESALILVSCILKNVLRTVFGVSLLCGKVFQNLLFILATTLHLLQVEIFLHALITLSLFNSFRNITNSDVFRRHVCHCLSL